jgi:dihydrolipoamide dehydrogenase
MSIDCDVAIIGSGPGGYPAAIRAAQLGFKTVCIDKRKALGGTCLNEGCIPSKALLHSSENYELIKKESQYQGIIFKTEPNFKQMMIRQKEIIHGLNLGIEQLFRKNNIQFIEGTAEFVDSNLLKINNNNQSLEIKAKYIIIATGSKAISLPGINFDEEYILSSTGALNLKAVPQKMAVIGAGVIGVELASVYNRLGAKVTVIEMLDHICPNVERDLSTELLTCLKNEGIEFRLSARVRSCDIKQKQINLAFDEGEKVLEEWVDVVLIAVGRRPMSEGLNLNQVGIKYDSAGYVEVDQSFRTSQANIFAIGDLIKGPMLAHRATAEGIAVVESLAGGNPIVNYLSIPMIIYTKPEVAAVGLTEEEANQLKLKIRIGKSLYRNIPRACCSGESEGFIKMILDQQSQCLLGMHIIGQNASELIEIGVLAMQQKMRVEDIANAAFGHPTLSEGIKEAALAALGRPIHS